MCFVLLFSDVDHLVKCMNYPLASVSQSPVSDLEVVSKDDFGGRGERALSVESRRLSSSGDLLRPRLV